MPPKSTTPKADNPKVIERILGNYLKRMLYAHSKDLETTIGDKPAGTSHFTFDHYDNYIATEGKIKLTARFSPGARTEQALRMLWEAYVTNLRENIDMQVGDTFDRLREKLDEFDEACPAAFVFRIWDKNHALVRDNRSLSSAYDDGKLRSHFATAFAKFAASETLMAIIVQTFDGFLRALALTLSAMNWYAKSQVEPLFWGFLIANGITQDHLLEWRGNMRPEPERKPKAKKTQDGALAAIDSGAPAAEPASAPAAEPASVPAAAAEPTVDPTPAPAPNPAPTTDPAPNPAPAAVASDIDSILGPI